MTLRIPVEWQPHFEDGPGLVFVADLHDDAWPAVEAELTRAFVLSRAAAQAGEPVTYVVHNDDLLGRRGAGRAMVATGLLSGARTAAAELVKAGVPFNVLAVEDDTDPATVAKWVRVVSEGDGPTGELIHLGPGHIGKALA
ncbi:MAG: hypothetical protein ACFCVC_21055 [Acidimicrobiia bacterium]